MPGLRLLLTGATGYIGGSILHTLLESKYPPIKSLEISVLVRGEDRAKTLAAHGLMPIIFDSLGNSEALIEAASKHDIVIHTASGFHTGAAKALVTGLGQRKAATGNDVYYFHTTGTSNIADKPITKEYHEARILSDMDDLYSHLKEREEREVYAQRTTDLAAIETGIKHDVKTYLIMSPLIYGLGSGLFNRHSIQIPNILRAAIRCGHVQVIGAGEGAWDQVHIGDLASLYELLLAKVLNGGKVPFGKTGIFFSETGDFTWGQLAEGLASELFLQGVIETDQVRQLSLEQGAQVFAGGNTQRAELGFASNSRSRAELSRELGWRPTRGRVDFKRSFAQEVKRIASETRQN